MTPEGGCTLQCEFRLPCGHQCPDKCHSQGMHDQVVCKAPCVRLKPGCDHPCRKKCHETCSPKCMEILNDHSLVLPCGHTEKNPKCWMVQHPDTFDCPALVERKVPGCGHTDTMQCHVDVSLDSYSCRQPCGAVRSCSHVCTRQCHWCSRRENGMVHTVDHGDCTVRCASIMHCGHTLEHPCHASTLLDYQKCSQRCGAILSCQHRCQKMCSVCKPEKGVLVDHGVCPSQCSKKLPACSHKCTETCHHQRPQCGTCSQPCAASCSHTTCPKKCSEACVPCLSPSCASQCPHSLCSLPCASPCDWVPCSLRCEKMLNCGHQCPSVCGEKCPTKELCQKCGPRRVRDSFVDLEVDHIQYRNVDLNNNPCIFLACGHFFTRQSLDDYMMMEDWFEVTAEGELSGLLDNVYTLESDEVPVRTGCPTCHGPMQNISRYGRIIKTVILKEYVKWTHDEFNRLTDELDQYVTLAMSSSRLESSHIMTINNYYKSLVQFQRTTEQYSQPLMELCYAHQGRARDSTRIPTVEVDESELDAQSSTTGTGRADFKATDCPGSPAAVPQGLALSSYGTDYGSAAALGSTNSEPSFDCSDGEYEYIDGEDEYIDTEDSSEDHDGDDEGIHSKLIPKMESAQLVGHAATSVLLARYESTLKPLVTLRALNGQRRVVHGRIQL
eukprot:Protomagalhaensia_sp_Gyna_25__111@NODE_1055_length_2243_cov_5_417423_g840_i0_p1_GENE_NODE_1055_length_2243_cov_5_417423_g840_i0NODE_1055_length_2243_cov_5_417423_g840_i0_p1_ORF_typecomplete_len725_score51_04_NODE_1055_length_2243_cov_5_417423_g840_i0682071